MHFMFLLFLTIISGIVAGVLAFCPDLGRWTKVCWALVFAFFVAWMVGFCTRPVRYPKTQILTPYTVVLDNGRVIQYVTYFDDDDGRPKTVNVNERFKCLVKDGTKVRRLQPSSGPYCGVSVSNTVFTDNVLELVD